MTTAAMTHSLDEVRAEATRLLRAYLRAAEDDRTPLLRELAERVVDLREHFTAETEGGEPDWRGKTYAYRRCLGDVYSDAGLRHEDQATVAAAIRYHVGNVLRERLDAETLEGLGLRSVSPRERSQETRSARSALVRAARGEDGDGVADALRALMAAVALLRRADTAALAALTPKEKAAARGLLEEARRRITVLVRALR